MSGRTRFRGLYFTSKLLSSSRTRYIKLILNPNVTPFHHSKIAESHSHYHLSTLVRVQTSGETDDGGCISASAICLTKGRNRKTFQVRAREAICRAAPPLCGTLVISTHDGSAQRQDSAIAPSPRRACPEKVDLYRRLGSSKRRFYSNMPADEPAEQANVVKGKRGRARNIACYALWDVSDRPRPGIWCGSTVDELMRVQSA